MAGWVPFQPEDIGKVVLITKVGGVKICGRLQAWAILPDSQDMAYRLDGDTQLGQVKIETIRSVAVLDGNKTSFPPAIRTNPNPINRERNRK